MRTRQIMFATLAALATTGYPSMGQTDGLAYGRSQAPAPIEGTWIMTIQRADVLTPCSAGLGHPRPGPR